MRVLAFCNRKGGVGKTTSALNIAAGLQARGKKVLFIDMDPQRNSTQVYRAKIEDEYTIYDVMTDACEIADAIQHTETLGDIVPGDPQLDEVVYQIMQKTASERILRKKLKKIDNIYDYVIIDTHPDQSIYVINALTASDGCIIPINADKFSIDGLADEMKIIDDVKENANENLSVCGILMTMIDTRNNLDKSMLENMPLVAEQLNIPYFKTYVRKAQAAKDIQTSSMPVFIEHPSATVSFDYKNLVDEILEREP